LNEVQGAADYDKMANPDDTGSPVEKVLDKVKAKTQNENNMRNKAKKS
jgi:hypothetical protein